MAFGNVLGSDKTVTINTAGPAQYGQTTNYGKYGNGVYGASNEAFDQMDHNNGEQSAIAGGVSAAQQAAANGQGLNQASQNGAIANDVAGGAGGNQQGAIALARQMALGQQPSQGAIQLQQGLNNSIAQQRSNAASARGGASIATAGANRNANIGNLQQNAYNQGQQLRANEMAAGAGMYGSMAADARNQAGQQLANANSMAQFNASQNDAYRLGMGGAAVGLGGVAVGQAGSDLDNFNRGMNPIYAQDQMNQQGQEWIMANRGQAAAANKEDQG
jgi:hypothetical protein